MTMILVIRTTKIGTLVAGNPFMLLFVGVLVIRALLFEVYIRALPAPPNYPLRDPKYHLIETIRPLIEVPWGV